MAFHHSTDRFTNVSLGRHLSKKCRSGSKALVNFHASFHTIDGAFHGSGTFNCADAFCKMSVSLRRCCKRQPFGDDDEVVVVADVVSVQCVLVTAPVSATIITIKPRRVLIVARELPVHPVHACACCTTTASRNATTSTTIVTTSIVLVFTAEKSTE